MKEERIPEVKNEIEMDEMPFEMEVIPLASENAQLERAKQEKTNLIKQLIVLKTDNQTLQLKVHNQQRDIEEKKAASKNMSENAQITLTLKHELDQQKTEATKNAEIAQNYKRELDRIKADLSNITKMFSALQQDKNALSTQVKQLQEAAANDLVAPSDSDSGSEYEVECIIDHETRKKRRRFLVQWKNSWVNEKNMHCPKLLNKYLKLHRQNK